MAAFRTGSPDKCLVAQNTIFGWAVGGSIKGKESHHVCLTATSADKRADEMMQHHWAMDAAVAVRHTEEEIDPLREPEIRVRELPSLENSPHPGPYLGNLW